MTRYASKPYVHKKLDLSKPKLADIIIPTLNRTDLMKNTLDYIDPEKFLCIVVRGTSYSQANNIGAKAAQTDNLIFCNDDVALPEKVLYELVESPYDIALSIQFDGEGNVYNQNNPAGLVIRGNDLVVTYNNLEADFPTSPVFRIKKSVFEEVGGFEEAYLNGAEDHDLFFKILEKGYRWGYVNTPIIHFTSQTAGRFDYLAENIKILNQRWPIERVKNLLKI